MPAQRCLPQGGVRTLNLLRAVRGRYFITICRPESTRQSFLGRKFLKDMWHDFLSICCRFKNRKDSQSRQPSGSETTKLYVWFRLLLVRARSTAVSYKIEQIRGAISTRRAYWQKNAYQMSSKDYQNKTFTEHHPVDSFQVALVAAGRNSVSLKIYASYRTTEFASSVQLEEVYEYSLFIKRILICQHFISSESSACCFYPL